MLEETIIKRWKTACRPNVIPCVRTHTYRGRGGGAGTRIYGKDKHPADTGLCTDGDSSVQRAEDCDRLNSLPLKGDKSPPSSQPSGPRPRSGGSRAAQGQVAAIQETHTPVAAGGRPRAPHTVSWVWPLSRPLGNAELSALRDEDLTLLDLQFRSWWEICSIIPRIVAKHQRAYLSNLSVVQALAQTSSSPPER